MKLMLLGFERDEVVCMCVKLHGRWVDGSRYVVELTTGDPADLQGKRHPPSTMKLELDFERGGVHHVTIDLDRDTTAQVARL